MSGRAISVAGAAHLKQPATTTCRCWIVTAVGKPAFGLTSLDRDITTIFPEVGAIQCKAHRGYTPYANQAGADLSVDNSEMQVLIAEFDMDGITLDAIHRGVYDDADFVEYLVNYTTGDVICILSSGKLGKVRQIDGIECFPELRSLTQVLKQKAIIEKGSVGCRVAAFGDERCKYLVDAEWVDATVTAVGIEADRTFTVAGVDVLAVDDYYRPGLVKFNTGANAGRSYEIESYTAAGVITLAIPTEELIAETDELEFRRDCTRQWSGHNSCETYDNRLNYRGEPWRPVADSTGLMLPGANSKSPGTDMQQAPE